MADDDDEIVWIREETGDAPLTPKTPATVIDLAPRTQEGNSTINPPVVTISVPKEHQNGSLNVYTEDENDRLSTNSVQPPDTPTSCDESLTFDLSECERNLNQKATEAHDLLNKLDEMAKKVSENNAKISKDINSAQEEIRGNVHKTIQDRSQVPTDSRLPDIGIPKNVESVIIGRGVVDDITGLLVLPNGHILVTDGTQGIILFSVDGDIIKKLNPQEFKRLECPIYHKEHVLILADVQIDGKPIRHVIKYTTQLDFVAKIECPRWPQEHTILRERISIAHTDHLYLCVCGETFSALYELTPIGKWTELDYKLSEAYIDMVAFATIGPITQLLVVEGRRSYVLLVSIRESQVVDKKKMAICERPGALAKDEAGRLFVANRASASVQLVDTMNWACRKNVALTDHLVKHFTAAWGLLALPLKNSIRLQRYSFR